MHGKEVGKVYQCNVQNICIRNPWISIETCTNANTAKCTKIRQSCSYAQDASMSNIVPNIVKRDIGRGIKANAG